MELLVLPVAEGLIGGVFTHAQRHPLPLGQGKSDGFYASPAVGIVAPGLVLGAPAGAPAVDAGVE